MVSVHILWTIQLTKHCYKPDFQGKGKGMVYSIVPGCACSHKFIPWLKLYIPAPSVLPQEYSLSNIIGVQME